MYQVPREDGSPRSTRRASSASSRFFCPLTARIQIRGSTGAPSVRANTCTFQLSPFFHASGYVWTIPGLSRIPLSAAGHVTGVLRGSAHGDSSEERSEEDMSEL